MQDLMDWPEYQELTDEEKRLVTADAIGITLREYRRRIGEGNLASYVECLEASKRWFGNRDSQKE